MPHSVRPYRLVNGIKVINLENYVNYYFVVIANRLSRGASAVYRDRFGIGVVEWRCMVMLALQDGTSAARISEVSGINKSLVSRALARLEELRYIENFSGSKKEKPRLLQFTAAGRELYREMVELTLTREKELRRGLSNADIEALLRILRVLFKNTDFLDLAEHHINLKPTEI